VDPRPYAPTRLFFFCPLIPCTFFMTVPPNAEATCRDWRCAHLASLPRDNFRFFSGQHFLSFLLPFFPPRLPSGIYVSVDQGPSLALSFSLTSPYRLTSVSTFGLTFFFFLPFSPLPRTVCTALSFPPAVKSYPRRFPAFLTFPLPALA